jgi:RNA:NAD 2'-phosphotransferase (TPT1/KptA family)
MCIVCDKRAYPDLSFSFPHCEMTHPALIRRIVDSAQDDYLAHCAKYDPENPQRGWGALPPVNPEPVEGYPEVHTPYHLRKVTRAVTKILRHDAHRHGIHRGEGWVHKRDLCHLLATHLLEEHWVNLVDSDAKGRYQHTENFIRCVQGHTFYAGLSGASLDVTSEFAHHATDAAGLSGILRSGIRNYRQAVHMLPGRFAQGCDQSRFPGKLGDTRYVVNIDIRRLRQCGIPVYRTPNGYTVTYHRVPPACITGAALTVNAAMDIP